MPAETSPYAIACKANDPDGNKAPKGWTMTERLARPGAREVPLESLRVECMARRGWSCILLTERIGWEEFPTYAEAIAGLIGARVGGAVDGPDTRMRGLRLGLRRFWIVYDDYPLSVSIEPRSQLAASYIPRLHAQLSDQAHRLGS